MQSVQKKKKAMYMGHNLSENGTAQEGVVSHTRNHPKGRAASAIPALPMAQNSTSAINNS